MVDLIDFIEPIFSCCRHWLMFFLDHCEYQFVQRRTYRFRWLLLPCMDHNIFRGASYQRQVACAQSKPNHQLDVELLFWVLNWNFYDFLLEFFQFVDAREHVPRCVHFENRRWFPRWRFLQFFSHLLSSLWHQSSTRMVSYRWNVDMICLKTAEHCVRA